MTTPQRTITIVSCLLLAIVIALAPALLSRRGCTYPPKSRCLANTLAIEGAKLTWMVEQHKTTNDVPEWQDLVGPDRYLDEIPKCPRGGSYAIGKISEPPSCSIADHNNNYYRQLRDLPKTSATDTNRPGRTNTR